MTAVLSPVETPTCDDLVIEELNTHWDEQLPCAQCASPATVRLLHRCCMRRLGSELCEPHRAYIIETTREWLEAGGSAKCNQCDHQFTAPLTIDDICEVVSL